MFGPFTERLVFRGRSAEHFDRSYYFKPRQGTAGPFSKFQLGVRADGQVLVQGWSVDSVDTSQLQHFENCLCHRYRQLLALRELEQDM
jgi:hypothetical protein